MAGRKSPRSSLKPGIKPGINKRLQPLLADAVAKLGRGEVDAALAVIEAAAREAPRSGAVHYLRGNAHLLAGRPEPAADSYRAAIAAEPALAEPYNNLGLILANQGHAEEAIASYRAALVRKPAYAEAHTNLGNILLANGSLEPAIAAFRSALAVRADNPEAWYNLANALVKDERHPEAGEAFLKALALRPNFPEALSNYAELLLAMGDAAQAMAVAHHAVACDAKAPESHHTLGDAQVACGQWEQAIFSYRTAANLRPNDPKPFIAAGNVLIDHDRPDEAFALFRVAHRLQPLTRRAGTRGEDFRVLLLNAPGAANTPSDYLVGNANYTANFVSLMPGVEQDLALLRRSGDVVVNLISDVDQGRGILPQALDLADRLEMPVVNHPRLILSTGRDAIACRLAGIPKCRIPRTLRVPRGADPTEALAALSYPLLVRAGGAHGGADMAKCADAGEAAAALARRPRHDHYLTEYADYRSADGHWRKYRLIFVDGQVFPYHLAIGEQWKVHHFSTDMANQDGLRREEEAFVSAPDGVFGPAHWAAFRTIRTAIGLDYFGIDCGLDQEGDIVMFEVNATMLVHDERATAFTYKRPYIARIKEAFDTMLAKRAGVAAS